MRSIIFRVTLVGGAIALMAASLAISQSRRSSGSSVVRDAISTSPIATIERDPRLQSLVDADAPLAMPFAVEFQVTLPQTILGPERGVETRLCRASGLNGTLAIVVEHTYASNPPYVSRDNSQLAMSDVDYDEDTNLIVWRPLRSFAYRTLNSLVVRIESQMLRIAPNGSIIGEDRHAQVFHRRPDASDGFEDLQHFLLVSGRSFGGRLAVVQDQSTDVQLAGRGGFSTMDGGWTLTRDALDVGGLIRRAEFVPDGHAHPTLIVETTGITKSAAEAPEVASNGTVRYLGGSVEQDVLVSTLSFVKAADEAVLAEAHGATEANPDASTTVYDLRRE